MAGGRAFLITVYSLCGGGVGVGGQSGEACITEGERAAACPATDAAFEAPNATGSEMMSAKPRMTYKTPYTFRVKGWVRGFIAVSLYRLRQKCQWFFPEENSIPSAF